MAQYEDLERRLNTSENCRNPFQHKCLILYKRLEKSNAEGEQCASARCMDNLEVVHKEKCLFWLLLHKASFLLAPATPYNDFLQLATTLSPWRYSENIAVIDKCIETRKAKLLIQNIYFCYLEQTRSISSLYLIPNLGAEV